MDPIDKIPAVVRLCLEDLAQRLQRELGDQVREVRLFGSYARGEARPDSDIDVLVLVEEVSLAVEKRVCAAAADVGLEHDLVISVLVWDADHQNKHEAMQTQLLRHIQAEGVTLWGHP